MTSGDDAKHGFYEHHPVDDIEPLPDDEANERAAEFVTRFFFFITAGISNGRHVRIDPRRVIGRTLALVLTVRPDLIGNASEVADKMEISREQMSNYVEAVREEFGITRTYHLRNRHGPGAARNE